MYFQKCCNERVIPRDLTIDEGEYICTRCGIYLGKTFVFDYKDLESYNIRKYKPHNPEKHVSHVLNHLECKEGNRPSAEDISKFQKFFKNISKICVHYSQVKLENISHTSGVR